MVLRRIVLVAVLLSCFWSAAQAQPLPDRRALTGRVTTENGTPIKGAQIVLRKQDEGRAGAFWGALTVSDADGAFEFPDAEEATYYLTVEAGGFAPEQNRSYVLDESARPLQVKLARLVPLALQILKTDGQPLAKARVFLRVRGEGGRGQRFPSVDTDEKGRFVFNSDGARAPLIPGNYSISVLAPGEGYVSRDDIDVQPVDNAKNSNAGVVELRLQSGGTLRAVAQWKNGDTVRPLGGANLSIAPLLESAEAERAAGKINRGDEFSSQAWYVNHNNGAPLVTRDGDGSIELTDLPPGQYSVRLLLAGVAPQPRQEIEVKANQKAELTFVFAATGALSNATTLEITLRDDKNQPLADTEIELQLRSLNAGEKSEAGAPPPPNEPMAFPTMRGISLRRVRTDAQGKAVLFPVAPGKWRVTLLGPGSETNRPRPGRRSFIGTPQDVDIAPQGAALTLTVGADKS